ncbi:diguanylate cyclase/phosphodiesterase [Marinobacter santoriniensis NKSG1]|uniref:Diguanylate cyclase/phosphodiesterase n=1 Tax=Marinobacter santoriniensis NKSG1 TaxID=1288826 RepID=M7D136_9GAMM|nr:diguanylate cyclase/phosphodiesterase [Marinobacter santoriniensis NKSG1]
MKSDFRFLPACDIKSGKLIYAEALMSGVAAIGSPKDKAILFDQLVDQVASGLAITGPDTRLAINLDFPTISQADFLDQLRNACDKQELDAKRVQIQLKEPELVTNEAGASVVSSCHSAGFHVAVDCFLGDDASFSILSHPHISTIKVDQSVTADIRECPIKQSFIKGLFSLSESLEKQLVISGVNSEEHVAVLAELGPRYFQGDFVGGPLAALELGDFRPAFASFTRVG